MDQATCPVCGGPNDCAIVEGKDRCWCFDAVIPPAVLARVPDEARGQRCVCPRCAQSAARAPKADDSD